MFLLHLLFLPSVLITVDNLLIQEVSHYNLEDEIKQQVENLKSTVNGTIAAALNTLDQYVRDVYNYRDDVFDTTELAILQEHQNLRSQLNSLKELGESAGQNVDICVDSNETVLSQLSRQFLEGLLECVTYSNEESSTIYNEASYRIDIFINDANVFDFQLNLCAGDLLCMSSLVTQIEVALIEIPQKIGVELEKASELYSNLKVLVADCSHSKVAQFTTEGGTVVSQVRDCVENLLN